MDFADFDAHRHTIETRLGPVSYVDVGEGPAALFLHGVATSAYLWRGVIDGVRDVRRCIAPDLPLHGQTPLAPGQDVSVGGLADVVAALVEALDGEDGGLGRVDLVANDTGGAVAQVVAARHPERLRTFTLTNCDTHDNLPPEAFAPVVELARQGAVAATAEAVLADPELMRSAGLGAGYEHPEDVPDDLLRAYLTPVLGTPEAAREFERMLVALDARDLLDAEPALKELTVPTLVVWGTGDEFFELSWAYWLRDTIPGVTEVVEVPGAKLFFPDERPDALVPPLRRHWAAHPPG